MVERTQNNFRLPGQYFIEETGLYYNWWRWYKSNVGRYYEIDLVSQVLPLSKYSHININFNLFSPYQYSYNNSVIYIDSNGQIPVPSPGCLLACALCLGEKELKDKIKKYNCSEKCKDKCRVKSNEDYLKCMSLCMGNPLPDLIDLGFKVSCAICIGCLLLEFAPVLVAA